MTQFRQNRAHALRIAGPDTERYVPLDIQAEMGAHVRPGTRRHYTYRVAPTTRPEGYVAHLSREDEYRRGRSRGQALLVVALMMVVLLLFTGLGVDVGNLMGKRSKLQSAVDSAALSAAQLMADQSSSNSAITTKAYQMLEANNITSNTLSLRQVDIYTTTSQVHIKVIQNVDTFFMRLIPAFKQVPVSAEATADLNAFAEINIKPYGIPGVVNELNISVWGPDSYRQGGDAYSPTYISGNTTNPENAKMPYGYLYRIDVPADYPDDHLLVQIFDPDSWNNPTPPPTPMTPIPIATFCPFPCAVPTATVYSTPTFYPNDGRFTWTGAGERFNTYLNLGAYPYGTTTPIPASWDNPRVSFWRVDEMRRPHDNASGINPNPGEWSDAWMDSTSYTLWHFDPHITSAFADPATLTDLTGGNCVGASGSNCVAKYTSTAGTSFTDLAWYQPNGFDITLNDPSCTYANNDCFARESNGNMYFYLYVDTSAGSSENNFDVRVGPSTNTNYQCNNLSNPNTNPCFANTQYFRQQGPAPSLPDWDSGGNAPALVLAKRALPLNLDTGDHFPMLFTQVNKNAAGQTLAVRHFDQDCTGGCGAAGSPNMQYQMQLCVSDGSGGYTPCNPLTSDSCFGNPAGGANGYVGPDNGWTCSGCPASDKVQIPLEGSSDYTRFFGPNGECDSSWLRLQSDPSYSQDTTVWEMPFARPRLIK